MDKSSPRHGRGVCREIHGAELWRFMELPVAARANTGPAMARYSSRAKYRNLKLVSKRARMVRKKSPGTILYSARWSPFRTTRPRGSAVNGTGLSVVMLGRRRVARRCAERWPSLDAAKKSRRSRRRRRRGYYGVRNYSRRLARN